MKRRLLAGSGAITLLAAALAAELRTPPAGSPPASRQRLAPSAQDASHAESPAADVSARQCGDAAPALPPDGEPARTPPTTHARPCDDTPPYAPPHASPAPPPILAATLPLAMPGTAAHQREDTPSACAASAPVACSSSPLAAALLQALAATSACGRCAGAMLACGVLPLAVSALAAAALRDPAAPAALKLVCALLALNLNPIPLPAQGTAHGTAHGTTRPTNAEISVTPEAASPAHADPGPEDPPGSAGADCAGFERANVAVLHCGASETAPKSPARCPEPTRGVAGALARLIRDALLHGGRAADAVLRNRALQLACQLATGSGGATFCRGTPHCKFHWKTTEVTQTWG